MSFSLSLFLCLCCPFLRVIIQSHSPWSLLWMWRWLTLRARECAAVSTVARAGRVQPPCCGAAGQPSQFHLRSFITFLGMRVWGNMSVARISFWGQSWICFYFHCPDKKCLSLVHSQNSGLSGNLQGTWLMVPCAPSSLWWVGQASCFSFQAKYIKITRRDRYSYWFASFGVWIQEEFAFVTSSLLIQRLGYQTLRTFALREP